MHRLPRALTLRHPSSPIQRPLHISRIQRIPRRQQRWQSQMIYRPNGEPMRMQAVRFKKPGFSTRRLLTFALYTGVVYGYLALLWRQLDVEIEFVEDEEQDEQQDEQDSESESESIPDSLTGPLYADEESTFIPLTWSTPLPRTYYRGSDPEWQEFIRIAKDSARHKRIQDELVQLVYTGCVQHPTISRQLGSNTQVGKYWLDISFPDGPPQEYERRGIEIGEGYIAWSAQKVDAEKQWRVERALVPKAAAEGVWKTAKVLAGIQWRRVKQRLGLEGVDPGSPEERYRVAVEMQQQQSQQQQQSGGQGSGESSPVLGSATSSSAAPAQPSRTPARSEGLPWHIPTIPLPSSPFSSSSSSSSATNSSSPTDMNSPSNLATALPIAIHVFSATLSKSWNPNPKKLEPPRGAFIVQGLVEVRGSKGRILFDVLSAYDPKGGTGARGEGGGGAGGGKFVNVNAAVRGYKRWRQSPKGGP